MDTFEIYFSDLTKEAQQRFLNFREIESDKEGNYDLDIFPITILEVGEIEI